MNENKPATVEEYIADFPENTREVLQQIRATIKQTAPEAEEIISYAIPTFTLNGTYLIYFAGFKNHTSLYPAPKENSAFKEELATYKGGKGTVQFPLNKPVPFDLIARIVQFRVKEILNSADNKKQAKKTNNS